MPVRLTRPPTGVLLVCVGQATRVAEYLMAGQKRYRAVIQLGLETDTYDLDGAPVATATVPPLTTADLTLALARFTGAISQMPPAYSAIKQAGVPAYRKARRGETVTLEPRAVTIHDITLRDWQPPHLTIDVRCDPGTYIRSLAHDLGQDLGCGAALAQLTRLQSGRFSLEAAVSLDALAAAAEADQVARYPPPPAGRARRSGPSTGGRGAEPAIVSRSIHPGRGRGAGRRICSGRGWHGAGDPGL